MPDTTVCARHLSHSGISILHKCFLSLENQTQSNSTSSNRHQQELFVGFYELEFTDYASSVMTLCADSFKILRNVDYEVAHLFKFIHYVHVIDACLVVLACRFNFFYF